MRVAAIKVLRHAPLLMHPAPRGGLYILTALTILSTDAWWVWPFGYAFFPLGLLPPSPRGD